MDILFFSILTNFLYYCSGRIFLSHERLDFHRIFYIYFFGIVFVSFSALLINFFFKLSSELNSVFFLSVLIIFFLKNKKKFNKKEVNFLLISSIITFLLIIYSNVNRPDAGLYHLPYTSLINENKIIFGINNIHFRFGHISILQYLSAINNNILFMSNGITIPLASIISLFYIYFGYDVWKSIKDNDAIDIGKIFSLFILIYISYKINRYSSFGNDAVPHLCFFYIISYVLKKQISEVNVNKLLLFSVFIFINKPTLGLVFIIPLALFFLQKNFTFNSYLKLIISFPTFLLFFWLIKNIIISGCAIYPIKITCIDKLPWTNKTQIVKAYTESEAWSKGWPDRKEKNISIVDFNKNFNWFKTWSDKHFKYILKIILPYIIVLFFITLFMKNSFFLYQRKKINKNLNTRFYLLLFTCFIGVLSFFLVFPIYRYGYSYIICLIALIFSIFLKNQILSKKNIIIFKIVLFVSTSVFLLKQSQKIYFNYGNKIWPNIYTFNKDGELNKITKIKISEQFEYYLSNSGDFLCMYTKSPCTSYKLQEKINHEIYYGYSFLNIE